MIVLALAKGRLLAEATELLRSAGLDVGALAAPGRRLLLDLPPMDGVSLRALVLKPDDVPTYVEHGAADVGICGSDVLREHGRDLYEPLDLGIGRCRLVLAGRADAPPVGAGTLRVATKFTGATRAWAEERGLAVDVIPLGGSVEIAPATGLADRIVDLVQSGETLRANGLREEETLAHVTARLVVNRAALKLKRTAVDALVARLRAAVEAKP